MLVVSSLHTTCGMNKSCDWCLLAGLAQNYWSLKGNSSTANTNNLRWPLRWVRPQAQRLDAETDLMSWAGGTLTLLQSNHQTNGSFGLSKHWTPQQPINMEGGVLYLKENTLWPLIFNFQDLSVAWPQLCLVEDFGSTAGHVLGGASLSSRHEAGTKRRGWRESE